MTQKDQKPLLKILICLVLAGITFAAFAGVAHCSFITLDDRVYVVANPPVAHGFSWNSVKWAFQTFHAGYWIPVTWLSHMLDCQLYGLNPAGHHVTNLIFHIGNTVLLFLLLQKLTARLWPSAFVALLFGIHPMHVESVAWIAERKDVLSSFFCLLTLLAYTRYAQGNGASSSQLIQSRARPLFRSQAKEGEQAEANPQSAIRNPQWAYYVLALFFFALGLMAKPMIVTLPFVLLLLDYWPLNRLGYSAIRIRQSALEKLPFFLLAAVSSYITFFAQRSAGAVKPAFEFSLADRLGHVPISYAWYLLKFFWPANLTVLYVLHKGTNSSLEIVAAVFLLLAITAFALILVRRYPYFLFGWLWFLGMLVPVIGFVQSGNQAYADRFAYLPYIGLLIVVAWGVPDLVAKSSSSSISRSSRREEALTHSRISQPPAKTVQPVQPPAEHKDNPHSAFRIPHWVIGAAAACVAVACFVRTIQETGYWKDGPTLYSRMLKLDPGNEMAWAILGSEYEIKGESDKALDCIKHSLSLDNHYNLAWEYLGSLLARKKDFAGAESAYQTALPLMWYKGDRIDTYNRLGDALASDGKYDQAIASYQSSLDLDPGQAEVQTKLGQALLKIQEPDQAGDAFRAAIDLQPDSADARIGLGIASESSGLDSEAVAEYRKAIEAEPDSTIALNNLAWLLATDSDPALRNGPEAVSLAEHACQLTHYEKAFYIGTLAAAYAEAGRFDDAVTAAQKAHDVALANGEKDLANRNAQLLQLYKSHQTYRAESGQAKAKN